MSDRYPCDSIDVSPLSKPLNFEFSKRTAKNRFLKASMTERLSSWSPTDLTARGIPSENLINVYRRWGEAEFGLILTGNIMVAYDQLEAPGNPVIDLENPVCEGVRFNAFKRLASAAKKHGSLIVGQVSHPGRQTEQRLQPDPISSSDIQLEGEVMGMRFAKPHAASMTEIQEIVKRFTHAAVFLHKAGYDGIQLHGAHGYLLAQFLSKTTNKRTDEYGGSLSNRARLIIEIAQSIRRQIPASTGFVLGIKINSVEFQKDGFSTDEAKQLCGMLDQNEFDFVELSGGTYEALAFEHKRESTKVRESFFLEFADLIAPALKRTRSYVTGGLKTSAAMVSALKTVDGVGLARPVCQEFHLPRDILQGKVKGAIRQKLDDQNFGLTNMAAGTQIRQVGKDEEPIDLSDETNVQTFLNSMGEWRKKMQEDAASMNMNGYVDLPKGNPIWDEWRCEASSEMSTCR